MRDDVKIEPKWVQGERTRKGHKVPVRRLFGKYPEDCREADVLLRLCEGPATLPALAASVKGKFHRRRKSQENDEDYVLQSKLPKLRRELPGLGYQIRLHGDKYVLSKSTDAARSHSGTPAQTGAKPVTRLTAPRAIKGRIAGHPPGSPIPPADDGYLRATKASLERILRKHATLGRRFSEWLKERGSSDIVFERSRVDIEFSEDGQLCRAELKVSGGISTTKALREALGQLLEYNYYGGRKRADRWYIVLDTEPSVEDRDYIGILRSELRLPPLLLCWPEGKGFAQH